ncbi:MAG: hypothetical protein IT381_27140 [Deltaproteobacteria bacterium]|nr:hypothetical protein [Deltaproteobacteria bacterium]
MPIRLYNNNLPCNAQVRWNGNLMDSARDSVFGDLTVTLTAAETQTLGFGTLSITTRDEPTVTLASAVVPIYLALDTNDLLFEPTSARLYATLPSLSGPSGNSVTRLAPETGARDSSTFVGSEPTSMAASADGQYIYALLSGSKTVRRFVVATEAAELAFPIGATSGTGAVTPLAIAVLPNDAHAIVALRSDASGRSAVVADDGVLRASIASVPAATIAFGASATVAYAVNDGGSSFYRLPISAGGIALGDTTTGLLRTRYPFELRPHGALFYTFGGQLLDPLGPTVLATLPKTGVVAVDSVRQRVFVLETTSNEATLFAFSTSTFALLGTQAIPGVSGTVTSLLRWGNDGFAFRTDERQVFLFHSSLAGP